MNCIDDGSIAYFSPPMAAHENDTPLSEIAEILAAGLTRLVRRQSSPLSASFGESSLGFSPQPSGDAHTFSRGVDA
jgi:hypothetical protein